MRQHDGLGLELPPRGFGVDDAVRLVGADTAIDVIDVEKQVNVSDWNMRDWSNYFALPQPRPAILNVLSLEVSSTPLGKLVTRPAMVRELDWVTTLVPERRLAGGQCPRVQKYLIMTAAGAYTDFHIDFGGSAVWYHMLSGRKLFLFAAPTDHNLAAYERWSRDPKQNAVFLGDLLDQVYSLEITTGNTLFIPCGWIHAVYTPDDSLVVGGNFLHGMGIQMQLAVRRIERDTGIAAKFRFPLFDHIQWYAAAHYVRIVRKPEFGVALAALRESREPGFDPLAKLGCSRFEVSGVTVLLKALMELSGAPAEEDDAAAYTVAEAAAEAAASIGCESPSALLEELIGRLEGTWTGKPGPRVAMKVWQPPKAKFRGGAAPKARSRAKKAPSAPQRKAKAKAKAKRAKPSKPAPKKRRAPPDSDEEEFVFDLDSDGDSKEDIREAARRARHAEADEDWSGADEDESEGAASEDDFDVEDSDGASEAADAEADEVDALFGEAAAEIVSDDEAAGPPATAKVRPKKRKRSAPAQPAAPPMRPAALPSVAHSGKPLAGGPSGVDRRPGSGVAAAKRPVPAKRRTPPAAKPGGAGAATQKPAKRKGALSSLRKSLSKLKRRR